MKAKGLLSLSDLERINEPVNKKAKGIRTNLPNFGDLTRIANKKPDGTIEILYAPPHGKELLQSLLIDMLDFVYDDETYEIHPLIKIALAHYQFESIHPFPDGNGRVGRLIALKECLHYDIVPFIIEDSKKAFYYRGLAEWENEKGYLIDTCLDGQDTFKRLLAMFDMDV